GPSQSSAARTPHPQPRARGRAPERAAASTSRPAGDRILAGDECRCALLPPLFPCLLSPRSSPDFFVPRTNRSMPWPRIRAAVAGERRPPPVLRPQLPDQVAPPPIYPFPATPTSPRRRARRETAMAARFPSAAGQGGRPWPPDARAPPASRLPPRHPHLARDLLHVWPPDARAPPAKDTPAARQLCAALQTGRRCTPTLPGLSYGPGLPLFTHLPGGGKLQALESLLVTGDLDFVIGTYEAKVCLVYA
uniref:Uncharacterized protein n=2 Tax=Aegilops tauschii subsp. strangulata TaxID=200361 RepID=A0A453CVH7_AEGTS